MMPSYADERREAVVAKLLPPRNLSVSEVARQEGISVATIYKWRKEAREQGRCLPNAGDGGAAAWSSKDKFAAVLETASMNAEETTEYCRRRGVFAEQILAWRHDCEQAASLSQHERRHEALDAKAQRQRIRELERDLRRKNAALAETAALLTLSKKAAAIWGDEES
jgi:transposase-like protein